MSFELGNKIINYLTLLHSPVQYESGWKSMIFDLEKMFTSYFGNYSKSSEKFVNDTITHLCHIIFEDDPDYDAEKHRENVKATINYIKCRQVFSSISPVGKCHFVNGDGTNCENESSRTIHCPDHTLEFKKFKKSDDYKTRRINAKIEKLEKRVIFLTRLFNSSYREGKMWESYTKARESEWLPIKNVLIRVQKRLALLQSM